ncbi:MAG TPA: hypothetical protein PK772_05030 [Chitinophagaceae bacterium]|nr:hypothetical protein [Chitinophagaceae bacterium]
MKYTIVILISTTEKWLRLTRKERNQFAEKNIYPLLDKYKKTLTLRMFDAEAFNAKHTDFLIIETYNLTDYYHFWEYIRDSKFYTEPYFIVNEIVVGQENAFKEFETIIKQ